VGIRCADHVTPLHPQKLALTWPTGGGRSVGIVRSRTKATEFMGLLVLFTVVTTFCNWCQCQTQLTAHLPRYYQPHKTKTWMSYIGITFISKYTKIFPAAIYMKCFNKHNCTCYGDTGLWDTMLCPWGSGFYHSQGR
jgi:hypothetical protein